MQKTSYYVINAITVYRMLASFLLGYLLFTGNIVLFKWLLAFSFFTDAIDGFLARKYKVDSILGAKLDSIADDLTAVIGFIGLCVLHLDFVMEYLTWILVLFGVFLAQVVTATIKYGKPTSFHTYSAKLAAVAQGVFLILSFFLPQPSALLFYIAFFVTIIDLAEEIILVVILPDWKTNVKGLLWLHKNK